MVSGSSEPLPKTSRWKREWRILRRKGFIVWFRGGLALRRFHKSLERLP